MCVNSSILAHDCELCFLDVSNAAAKSKEKPDKVIYKGNPLLNGVFLNEDSLVTCGFDKVPYLFKKASSGWEFSKILDEGFTQVKQQAIAMGSFD